MDDKDLIKILKDYVQTCTGDKHYDFNPVAALIIANRMEQLIALAENGQSALDTNKILSDYIMKMKSKLETIPAHNIKITVDDDNLSDYNIKTKFKIGDKVWILNKFNSEYFVDTRAYVIGSIYINITASYIETLYGMEGRDSLLCYRKWHEDELYSSYEDAVKIKEKK